MIADYLPGAAGASSPPADLAEVVCADLDLLTLEFDELVAANYPGLADRPRPPATASNRPPAHPAPAADAAAPADTGGPPPFVGEQADEERASARQRGPPVAMPAGRSSAQEVMARRRTGRGRSPFTAAHGSTSNESRRHPASPES